MVVKMGVRMKTRCKNEEHSLILAVLTEGELTGESICAVCECEFPWPENMPEYDQL